MKDLSLNYMDILARNPLKNSFYDENVFLMKDGLTESGKLPVIKKLTKLILQSTQEPTAPPAKFTIDDISLLLNDKKITFTSIIKKLSKP